MKTILPKKTRRIVACYLAALIILYVVIYVVPKVTDLFETTQVLENGTLIISCDAEGYLVKDESINVASKNGTIKYKIDEGTVIKKDTDVLDYKNVDPEDADKTPRAKYEGVMENLRGYKGIDSSTRSPISGVLSFTMDGNEAYFTIKNLKKITKDGVEGLSYGTTELKRDDARKGEPIFKVSSAHKWYVICWISEEDAKAFEKGTAVTLQLPEGEVNAPIGRDSKNRLRMGIDPKNGREAVTRWKVVDEFRNYTLLHCRLLTGRTHQIRVHMASIGHPLAGDVLYGGKSLGKEPGQYLHAGLIGFTHPATGEYLEFEAPLPEYFAERLRKLER